MMVECREDLEVASHPDREAWSLPSGTTSSSTSSPESPMK
jgi:hypothetical protein